MGDFGSSLFCVGNLCESSVRSVTLWWQSVTGLEPVANDIPPQRHKAHRVRTEFTHTRPRGTRKGLLEALRIYHTILDLQVLVLSTWFFIPGTGVYSPIDHLWKWHMSMAED